MLLIFTLTQVSCGPTESERLEMERKSADSIAAANAMMEAAKEAARIQAELIQKQTMDSLAGVKDTIQSASDTSSKAVSETKR
jgi:hypothetical protein